MGGSAVKIHDWARMERGVCKTDNFVPLVVPGLSANSGSSSSSTTTPQDSSCSSSSPVLERSDGTALGNWLQIYHQNRRQKNMTEEIRTTVCETFLSGWRSSQIICKHHLLVRAQLLMNAQCQGTWKPRKLLRKKSGYTPGCAKCVKLSRNEYSHPGLAHSQDCRTKIESRQQARQTLCIVTVLSVQNNERWISSIRK